MYIDLKDQKRIAHSRAVEFNNVIKRGSLFVKNIQTVVCSSCECKMKKSTADQQIENKRENAPICVACILGKERNHEKRERKIYVMDCIRKGIKNEKVDNERSRRKELNKLSER